MTPQIGLQVVHRRYVAHGHAHYGGDLVDGAYVLGLFGAAPPQLCIRSDGDAGLFAGYDRVEFKAPVKAGGVVEVTATLDRIGRRSRGVSFEATVACRGEPVRGPSAARVCEP